MIGKITTGKSFRGCISYCLEDKLKLQPGEQPVKDRAEVLCYNLCYGDKKELIKQFNEVRNLNPKLSKPVLHITLSFPKGEQLNKASLQSMAEDCAREMGFDKNQYIAIEHNDTGHRHVHIVVNRVGFDGKTVKDNHNYKRIADYCRKMELRHGLQQVLNPRRYQTKELRKLPRLDQRKEQLKNDIRECLSKAHNYQQFEQLMRQKKYQVLKARGIAFIDSKKVRVKGSEVGYSISRIEKILSLPAEQKKVLLQKDKTAALPTINIQPPQQSSFKEKQYQKAKELTLKTNELLLKPETRQENIHPALLKKKRKKKRGLHL